MIWMASPLLLSSLAGILAYAVALAVLNMLQKRGDAGEREDSACRPEPLARPGSRQNVVLRSDAAARKSLVCRTTARGAGS
jgi:hypothetical protein